MFKLLQREKIITSKSIFFVTGIALLFSSSILHAEDSERPNIVWIIAEDMSPDLGCYGNQVVTTPNIDGLAEKGCNLPMSSPPVLPVHQAGQPLPLVYSKQLLVLITCVTARNSCLPFPNR